MKIIRVDSHFAPVLPEDWSGSLIQNLKRMDSASRDILKTLHETEIAAPFGVELIASVVLKEGLNGHWEFREPFVVFWLCDKERRMIIMDAPVREFAHPCGGQSVAITLLRKLGRQFTLLAQERDVKMGALSETAEWIRRILPETYWSHAP